MYTTQRAHAPRRLGDPCCGAAGAGHVSPKSPHFRAKYGGAVAPCHSCDHMRPCGVSCARRRAGLVVTLGGACRQSRHERRASHSVISYPTTLIAHTRSQQSVSQLTSQLKAWGRCLVRCPLHLQASRLTRRCAPRRALVLHPLPTKPLPAPRHRRSPPLYSPR